MTLIDRYVLFLFVRTFLICFMSITGLIVVGHVFANIDEFIEYGRTQGSIGKGLLEYYGPNVLSIFDRMCGMLSLMSVMFVIAWLYRTNEMTATLAAGISKGRIIRPLLVASCLIFVLGAINRELVLPRYSEILGKNPQDLAGQKQQSLRPTFDQEYGILISGRHMLPYTREIFEPILKLDGPTSALGKQLTADIGKYMDKDEKHNQGYLLLNVRSPRDIDDRDSIRCEGRDFILTHKDTPWVLPGQCFVSSSLELELLSGGASWRQYASAWEIAKRLRAQPEYYGDDTKTAFHGRLIQPLLDLTLLLLGIPIVLARPDRHLFLVAGTSLWIVGGFMTVVLGLQLLGSSGTILSPAVAAWAPLLLLLPFAWVRAKKAMLS